jgi:hypothetical protein
MTLRQFKAVAITAATTVYTVSPNQKGIIKGLAVHNPSSSAAVTFTLTAFGVAIYTTRTVAALETFECASAINKFGLPADTISITPSAALNVLGSAIEVPAQ